MYICVYMHVLHVVCVYNMYMHVHSWVVDALLLVLVQCHNLS